MANPIIKILRGSGTPPTLEAGRIAIDQLNKNLYVGISDGAGGTINEIVGGSGTFATKAYVDDAVTSGTGSLGTLSTQNADSVAITGGAIDGTAIGATTASSGAFTTLTASEAPINSTDVVRKTDLDSAISALGSVFRYVGDISLLITGFDLDTLPDTLVGAYYRVDVAGTYTAMVAQTQSFEAKVGDAFVQTTDGWQKLDNVDAEVLGTANEISVSGDENAGYTVAIDSAFKTRVDDIESKTQNIDPAGTTAGTTQLNGSLFVKANNTDLAFSISSSGEISIGAPGADIYLDRPTYMFNNLVGIDNGSGFPAITDFIIDGGEY